KFWSKSSSDTCSMESLCASSPLPSTRPARRPEARRSTEWRVNHECTPMDTNEDRAFAVISWAAGLTENSSEPSSANRPGELIPFVSIRVHWWLAGFRERILARKSSCCGRGPSARRRYAFPRDRLRLPWQAPGRDIDGSHDLAEESP